MPKYAIEVCTTADKNGHNNRWMFPPTQERLRGRWNWAEVQHLSISEAYRQHASQVPVIPGICIVLDTDAASGTIFDPLKEDEKGQEVWRKLQLVEKAAGNPSGLSKPKDIVTQSDLDEDAIKEWLYWIVRGVEAGHARLMDGSAPLPNLRDVKAMPGKRQADPLRKTPFSEKDVERGRDVADVVKPSGKRQATANA